MGRPLHYILLGGSQVVVTGSTGIPLIALFITTHNLQVNLNVSLRSLAWQAAMPRSEVGFRVCRFWRLKAVDPDGQGNCLARLLVHFMFITQYLLWYGRSMAKLNLTISLQRTQKIAPILIFKGPLPNSDSNRHRVIEPFRQSLAENSSHY